jgi:putative DNA methylase
VRVFSASPYYALVVFYQRRLPHWHYIGQPVFVTFRLHDSLPPNRSFPERAMTSGTAFAVFDRLLDHARSGPTFLREPAVANVSVDSIVRGADEFRHYEKHAWVVMPNHVHLLITPMTSVPKLLGLLKTATARKSNLLLVRSGKPFWQDESYDRVVRTWDEFVRIRRYIENNPVRAGLASTPERYEWSSAQAACEAAAGHGPAPQM